MCVDPSPCSVPAAAMSTTGSPLVVAGLYKLSGGGASDQGVRQAVDLAALQMATMGRAVTHVVCDTGGDPAAAANALRVAVEVFHAVAVVGPRTSDEVVKGIAPIVRRYGAVVVSPSATNPSIAQLDDGNLIWRTCPSDNLQAKVLTTLVATTAKLDLVYVDKNTYATGLEQAFTQQWGGTVSKAIVFESGMAAASVAQMDDPASALLIADADAPALVAALAATPALATTQFFMTDSAQAPSLWGAPPYDFTFLARIQGTAPGLPPDGDPSAAVYRTFSTDYKAQFNGEDPADTAHVANAYDAIYAIAIAAAAAGDRPSGAAIAANLARLSTAGAASILVGPADAFSSGVDTLKGGHDINLVGASGPIDFTADGDVATAPIEVWGIAQGGDGQPIFTSERVITP
jgi:branched-chain amino acid transport system substrate-binding protein